MPKLHPDWWQEVSPYLDEVLALPQEDRSPWLDRLRAESPELADRVQQLMAQHAMLARDGFLEGDPLGAEYSPGQVFGTYVLVSVAGSGGMGTVWRAKRNDGRFERDVAIKLLPFLVAGSGNEDRFKREGAILGRLRHPHIAELIDAGLSPTDSPT